MAKQPKDNSSLHLTRKGRGSLREQNKTLEKLALDNRKAMSHQLSESLKLPVPLIGKPLFNPDDVKNIFRQTLNNLSELAKENDELHLQELVNIPEYLNDRLKKFQTRETEAKKKTPKTKSSEKKGSDNPFFDLLHESYLLNLQFLKEVGNRIDVLDPILSKKLTLYTHHLVDALSVSPHPFSNSANFQGALKSSHLPLPGVAQKSLPLAPKSKGPEQGYTLGKNIALTAGKVVFQNDLFQLIQYAPLTPKVAENPLLIVPSWANKYYIFDLTPENSFVKWAVESGLTVFVISWVNPTQKHKDKTLSDYVLEGVGAAVEQICRRLKVKHVNALGYSEGGILLSCLVAYMVAKKDPRISSAAFLATPFDFNKIDELGIYRNAYPKLNSQKGPQIAIHLESQYMLQALNLLKANDLIWSTDVNHYLMGQEKFPFEMLHWSCDVLRLPETMQKDYLREVLIENKLTKEKGIVIGDTAINLKKIKVPLYLLAAYEDHIAPWRSVYVLTQWAKEAKSKFILAGGGHVKGVFNSPSQQNYHYWEADSLPKETDQWGKTSRRHSGSWWTHWRKWLAAYEGGQVNGRTISKKDALENAPGSFAKEI